MVGKVIVGRYSIELRGGLVVLCAPACTAIVADVGASVVRIYHSQRIVWRYPQVVVVAMRCSDRIEGAPRIVRFVKPGVQHIDYINVLWIGIDAGIVPGALPQLSLLIHSGPVLAAVVRTKYAAILRLYDCPHALRVGR